MSLGRRDDGFTLTELLVVFALLGFVLSVAYGLLQITQVGTDAANREAWMAREVAAPLEFAERVLSQQYQIQEGGAHDATPYKIAILTNRGGGTGERYVIEATTDNRLIVTSSLQVTSPVFRTGVWSENNFNRQTGTPLFRYYDAGHNEITDMTKVNDEASYVVVTIVTRHDGQFFEDKRRVFFRNPV